MLYPTQVPTAKVQAPPCFASCQKPSPGGSVFGILTHIHLPPHTLHECMRRTSQHPHTLINDDEDEAVIISLTRTGVRPHPKTHPRPKTGVGQ